MASTAFLTTLVSAWRELAAIADQWKLAFRRVEPEGDRRMRDFVQEHRLAGDLVVVRLAEHRLGHPREVREFVDHAPDIADLANDRVRQPVERLLVGDDFLAEAPLQPVRGKLDRSQRIADFVGDAPRDIRPGRPPLISS